MNLLTTKAVGLILGLTPDAVRWHEKQGHILAIRVERGAGASQRLFVREDIERFQKQRAAAQAARQAGDAAAPGGREAG